MGNVVGGGSWEPNVWDAGWSHVTKEDLGRCDGGSRLEGVTSSKVC